VNTSVLREHASSVSRFEIMFLTDQRNFDLDLIVGFPISGKTG